MKSALPLLISASLLSSCGWLRRDSNNDNQSAVANPILSIYPPDSYAVEDEICQSTENEIKIQKTGIQRWEGLNVTAQLSDLLHTKTAAQGTLESEALLATVYGREYSRDCDATLYEKYGCIDPATKSPGNWNIVKGKGGALRVCKNDHQYDRFSYEGVGLTSLHYVNQARDQFEKAGGQQLPRIILETLPVVKDVVKDYQRTESSPKVDAIFYHVHNAAYAQSERGDEFIFIFPETKDLGYVPRGYLWESAFVLSHEFGHHIEKHLLGDTFGKLGLTRDPFLHKYYSTELRPNDSKLAALGAKPLLNSQVAGSFSEGFADLASLYAMDGRLESLTGIECLGYNRNPLNGVFKDGTLKTLNDSVTETLITGKTTSVEDSDQSMTERISSCDIPRFTDIHVVGAILAYYFNSVLASTVDWSLGVASTGADETPDPSAIRQRYRILIAAVKKIESMVADHPQRIEQEQFDYFVRAVETSVKEFIKTKPAAVNAVSQSEVMSKLCLFSKQTLPALSYVPFSNAAGQCANITP